MNLAERSECLGRKAVRRNRADSPHRFSCLHRVHLSSIFIMLRRAPVANPSRFRWELLFLIERVLPLLERAGLRDPEHPG